MDRTLNLGIVAHVDAGKTSLTERLLHAAGVIDEVGRVDDGTTRTDTLALERRRGITIKAAVVAFRVGDTVVDLVDTPGHPDFIAEVERALAVLDGAVLVVSAVEGVQAQTRVLARTLRRLGLPTLIFVNKVDRRGARAASVAAGIAGGVVLSTVTGEGTPAACVGAADPASLIERLAEHDDGLLAAFADDRPVPPGRIRAALRDQTRRGLVHPALFGSAVTGAGVDALLAAVPELLPASRGDATAPPSGTVFAIERGPGGERVADVRMWAGTLRVRDRLDAGLVTGLGVFDDGRVRRAGAVPAGRIAQVRGLHNARIGDAVGAPRPTRAARFGPPTLESVVLPGRLGQRGALHAALSELADQDPLIGLRADDAGEIAVSLYGEVQKEVIAATLDEEYGVPVTFRETRTLCLERPAGTGAAVEIIGTDTNPHLATVGLRIEPGPVGSGVAFGLEVELGSMPPAFFTAVRETVPRALGRGLRGWEVTDAVVTMTHSGYWARQSHAHGTFDKSMSSTAGDFRDLTRVVVARALEQAGTTVHEPVHRFRLDVPADLVGAVLPAIARLGASPQETAVDGARAVITGEVPAARMHAVTQRLPGLTRGEGSLESEFSHHRPV